MEVIRFLPWPAGVFTLLTLAYQVALVVMPPESHRYEPYEEYYDFVDFYTPGPLRYTCPGANKLPKDSRQTTLGTAQGVADPHFKDLDLRAYATGTFPNTEVRWTLFEESEAGFRDEPIVALLEASTLALQQYARDNDRAFNDCVPLKRVDIIRMRAPTLADSVEDGEFLHGLFLYTDPWAGHATLALAPTYFSNIAIVTAHEVGHLWSVPSCWIPPKVDPEPFGAEFGEWYRDQTCKPSGEPTPFVYPRPLPVKPDDTTQRAVRTVGPRRKR